jgi:vacuolar-type H+-ATPase subunit I/STV1
MSAIERHRVAVREYERAVAEVAEHRVVDEAEDVLSRAWVVELEEMRKDALRLAAAARLAERDAQTRLMEARKQGQAQELALAHARYVETETGKRESLGQARSLLASVDVELESLCRAGIERSRRERQDLDRLRAARVAAYGTEAE